MALCDVFLPEGNGVDLVLNIKKLAPNVEVMLLTAHGNIPDGVQAIKNGAFDYITKGDDNTSVFSISTNALPRIPHHTDVPDNGFAAYSHSQKTSRASPLY